MRGDICFYTDNDFGAKIIQWRTRGPYDHVCVDIGNGHVIEAKWPEVSVDILGSPSKIFTPLLPSEHVETGMRWLETTVGDKYDLLDIAANIFSFMLPTTKIIHAPTAFICSELTAYYLYYAGYTFPAGFFPDERSMSLVTPNSLARAVGVLK